MFCSRCPKCGAFFAKERGSSEIVDSHQRTAMEMRTTAVYRDSEGRQTGTREELVPVTHTKVKVRQDWSCRRCKEEWQTEEWRDG
jgi:hypothetical protein